MIQLPHPQAAPPVDLIARWNGRFRTAAPQTLLAWASGRWDQRLALSCSFGGATGMVLLDMVMAVAPDTTVLYIDTGLLFPETYQLVEQVRQRYGVEPQAVRPEQTLAQQAEHEGAALWERSPNRCCDLRKVQPLAAALKPFDAWISGLRRDVSASRASTPLIEWSARHQLFKLNPLAFWTEHDVWRYIHEHDVPYNPLLNQGYSSLGCTTCTRPPINADPRSGRWIGFDKSECGLHIDSA